jgi:hypothetical protein
VRASCACSPYATASPGDVANQASRAMTIVNFEGF